MAAINNEVGVVGVGPVLDLYAVKVLNDFGYGTYSDLIQGIDWAVDEGAEVINMSLGGDEYSNALEDACDKAYEKGVVLVAAAGNDGDGDPSTNEVCYPAKYKSVIAVAATNKEDKTPEWSSEGSQVELVALGVDILSTTPRDDYDKKSGTSMATPHVSGTAALVIVKEGRNPNNVRKILHSSCIDLYSAGRDNYSGYGLIQAGDAVTSTG